MSRIMNVSSKLVGKAADTKPMTWLAKKFTQDPEKYLGYTVMGSIVVKDGVGCWMYVQQSKNNKDIHPKRRPFVIAQDLSNGVLMIVAQIALYAGMRKFSEPLFNKWFRGSFNPDNARFIPTKIRHLQSKNGTPSARKIELDKKYNEVRKDALDIFKFVLDTAAATIVGKRMIVPFISTPIAAKLESKFEEKHGSEQELSDDKNATPSMTGTSKQEDVKASATESTNLLAKYRK